MTRPHASTVPDARRLLDYLRARQEDMTAMVIRLVRSESPSDVPDTQAGVQEMLFYALEERGYRVRRIRGHATGGHLLAAPRSRPRHASIQLLLGHCDTVWPLGTLVNMPVHTREGRLSGPGVYDMKAGLVHSLFALDAIRAAGLTPEVVPVIFINSDEEIGSGESRRHIIRLARIADRAFVMEPSYGREGRLKTGRKGVGRFTVTVRGRAAHAGLDPEKGVSAILELSHVIQRLFELNDAERGITVNVGTIEGGLRPNVIAPESQAIVDVRVLNHEHAAEVERAMRELESVTPGAEVFSEGGFGRPPMEHTPGNRRLWELASQAARELGLEIDEATAGGGSDGNLTSLHTPTLDGLGAVGGGAHAVDEFIELDRMPERAALLARLLLEPPMHCRGHGDGGS